MLCLWCLKVRTTIFRSSLGFSLPFIPAVSAVPEDFLAWAKSHLPKFESCISTLIIFYHYILHFITSDQRCSKMIQNHTFYPLRNSRCPVSLKLRSLRWLFAQDTDIIVYLTRTVQSINACKLSENKSYTYIYSKCLMLWRGQ